MGRDLIAVAFGCGNVVFEGAWDWGPHGVHQAHDVVAQLCDVAVEHCVQVFAWRDDHAELGDICHIVQAAAITALKLPAQMQTFSPGGGRGGRAITLLSGTQ